MKSRKRIGITFGDIAGIGPEVIAKALISRDTSKNADYVLFGDPLVFKKALSLAGHPLPTVKFGFAHQVLPKTAREIDFSFSPKNDAGKISAECGKMAVQWINEAVLACQKGLIDAMVTAPIHKEACHLGGFKFKGHTDFIAHLCHDPLHKMMFYSEKLKTILVSHHQSLLSAIKNLSSDDIADTIEIGNSMMKNLGVKKPLVLVSGINPHAGENGAFGSEEIRIISPAVEASVQKGIHAVGPLPPDTIFGKALANKNSLVVAMTHDLGLVAFKLIAFETGVNVTAGLPLIRTSPDHGTAFDIAWKGKANPGSMISAINLAVRLAGRR